MPRLEWHPNGDYLAVPSAEGIHIIERSEASDDWQVSFTLKEQGIKEAIVARWSSNGRFLVSSHADGNLYLWDVEGAESLDRYLMQQFVLILKA